MLQMIGTDWLTDADAQTLDQPIIVVQHAWKPQPVHQHAKIEPSESAFDHWTIHLPGFGRSPFGAARAAEPRDPRSQCDSANDP
eukprot:scaffold2164_cov132-Ochromonas_danica.AAC.4